jgi:SHS2 domain-containing protein
MQVSATGFQILDSQTDLGFRAWGPNLHDLFAECARALTSVIVDLASVEPSESSAVEIIGDDLEGLLHNWLAEILYLFDGGKKVFSDFDVVSHTRNGDTEFLQAELTGELFEAEKHQVKTAVKAVSLERLSIEHGEHGYVAQVFLET